MQRHVFYHAGCNDGFGAAWAAWRLMGDSAIYRAVSYGQAPPPIDEGDEVFIVDFSYPEEALRRLAAQASRVVVLDHHKTAVEALAGLLADPPANLELVLDLSRSGAMLAWRYFMPADFPPTLLRYVEDRDLWRWKLSESEAINAWISAHPLDFEVWTTLAETLASPSGVAPLGRAILQQRSLTVERLCAGAWKVELGGHRVPVVNSPIHQSEIGHRLCELHDDAPFAAVYQDLGGGRRRWSLRSRGDFDVSEVAGLFGGGGHRAAAGFVVEVTS